MEGKVLAIIYQFHLDSQVQALSLWVSPSRRRLLQKASEKDVAHLKIVSQRHEGSDNFPSEKHEIVIKLMKIFQQTRRATNRKRLLINEQSY